MSRSIPTNLFDITVILKTLQIVWKSSKSHTIIRILIVILTAVLPLIPLYLFKLILDAFSTNEPVDIHNVLWIMAAMCLIALIQIIIKNISAYNNSIQTDIIADHMASILIKKSLSIDLEFYDSDKYHDQVSRAMAQGGTKPITVLNGVTSFFQSGLTLAVIVVLLFTLHWSIIFILFIITLPVAFVRFKYSEKLIHLQEKQTQDGRVTSYYRSILTGGGTAKEVRMFSFGNYFLDKFLSLAKLLRKERRDLYLEELRWVSIAQSAEVIATLSALGFIIYKATHGNMSVGDISFYYLSFHKGQTSVSGLMNATIGLHKQKLTLNYLYEFLNMTRRVKDPDIPKNMPNKIDTLKVNDLSFIYPGTSKVVLDKINFSADKGEIIAIVGENGSGKTTLIKLINRLYEPTSGHILLNGIDNKLFTVESIRNKITVIFQKFSSYALTVKENIWISDVHNPIMPEKIQQAAKYAQADTFIQNLPLKYDTKLGRAFKDGYELSKGQWQKIALSRAFYKNGDIIILDEPTSFIDPIAEDSIFQNFKSITKDKILILITHRIYNLRMADKILVMDKGSIVEIGTHEELVKLNGLYMQMFDKQQHD